VTEKKAPGSDQQAGAHFTAGQRYFVDFMMDVLIYTVVLNLFVEFVDSIAIDSFAVSLLTAVVMKGLIDLINALLQRTKDHFGQKDGTTAKVVFAVTAWAIMFFSKIVILEVVQIIFEDDVDLGGFLNVLVLVLAMMVARGATAAVFGRLGGPHDKSHESAALSSGA
jgi:hypothetical protein